jgi:hypothetical protein
LPTRKLLAAASSLLLLTACQGGDDNPPTPDAGVIETPDSGTPDSGTPDSGTPDSGTFNPGPANVQGGGSWHYIASDGGIELEPRYFTDSPPAALIPDATGTTYTVKPATLSPNGDLFAIDNVTAPYLLRFGSTYVWFSGRSPGLFSPDLSYPVMHRISGLGVDPGTRLALDATGLAAWQADLDEVQLSSPFAGLSYFALTCAPSFTAPAAGATSISHTFDWETDPKATCGNEALLIDGPKGDAVYVTQLVGRMASNSQLLIKELKRGYSTTSFRLTNAQTTTLDAPLAVLQTASRGFDLRFGAFREAALQAHPNAAVSAIIFGLGTMPGLKALGPVSGYPDLAVVEAKDVNVPDQTVSFEYGNPFPSAWGTFITVRVNALTSYSVPLPAGGSAPAVNVRTAVSSTTELPATQSGAITLQPVVGPARSLLVNGQSATGAPLTGIGTTPLLSWQAPGVGTADFYRVAIHELRVSPTTGRTVSSFVADFFTEATSLRVPSDVLTSGKHYYFRVLATRSSRWNPDRPFLTQFGEGTAVALSSRLSP